MADSTSQADRERIAAARALIEHAAAGRVAWSSIGLAVLVLLDKVLDEGRAIG